MLLKNECTQVSSILVKLFFDDETLKIRLISIDDLVDITYNANGIRKRILGRVSNISTVGTEPSNWYIIVDGSDDFASERVRFAPNTILDCEVIRKASMDNFVKTPKDSDHASPYIRVNKGRLQYSTDGIEWNSIKINEEDIIYGGGIEPQEGTAPIGPPPGRPPRPRPPKPPVDDGDDDEIIDANY